VFGIFSASGPGAIVAVLIGVALLQVILFLALSWWTVVVCRGYTASWQMRLFRAVMDARWLFVTERKSGDLVNVIVTETTRLGAAVTNLVNLLAVAVIASIYLMFALLISPQATLWLIGGALTIGLLISPLYRTSYGVGSKFSSLNSQLQVLVGE